MGLSREAKMGMLEEEIDMRGYDTVVECKKCGKRQYLYFANGLKNGWSKCCGETMPIVKTTADLDKEFQKFYTIIAKALRVVKKINVHN